MSSQRCLLVTVVMVRGVVVVVGSTYLIHCSAQKSHSGPLTVTWQAMSGETGALLHCVSRTEPSSRLRLRHCSLPLSAAPSTTDCFHTLRLHPRLTIVRVILLVRVNITSHTEPGPHITADTQTVTVTTLGTQLSIV